MNNIDNFLFIWENLIQHRQLFTIISTYTLYERVSNNITYYSNNFQLSF